jgi:hypothetical protein
MRGGYDVHTHSAGMGMNPLETEGSYPPSWSEPALRDSTPYSSACGERRTRGIWMIGGRSNRFSALVCLELRD